MALSKEEMRLIAGILLGSRSLIPGVGEPGSRAFVLSGAQALALQGSYVYEVWRMTDTDNRELPVYVGVKTGQGERPFNPRHHVLGEGFKWQDGDVLVISPMDSPEIARWVEKVVISDFMTSPPFNTLLLTQQPAYPEDLDAAFAATQPAPPSDKPVPLGAYLIDAEDEVEEPAAIGVVPMVPDEHTCPDCACFYRLDVDLPFDVGLEPVAEIAAPTAAEVEVAELERMLEPRDQAGGS